MIPKNNFCNKNYAQNSYRIKYMVNILKFTSLNLNIEKIFQNSNFIVSLCSMNLYESRGILFSNFGCVIVLL
jgi:hypothetical protein